MLILLGSWTLPYSTDSPLLTFFFFFIIFLMLWLLAIFQERKSWITVDYHNVNYTAKKMMVLFFFFIDFLLQYFLLTENWNIKIL